MPYRLPPFTCEATFVALAEQVDWSLTAYQIPAHWVQTEGQGIKVAVLDTGIDADHPDLAGAIDEARDFTDSPSGPRDRNGHGTHVAGTIAARRNNSGVIGVAPECRLLIAKVLGDDGSGGDQAVARGVQWAIESGADILSMSLGSRRPGRAMQEAIELAAAHNKLLICAAGNDGRDNAVNYPARWPSTLAVGAVDRHGRVCPFSSRGEEVDVAAPGEDILSAWPGGAYAKLSGTSMATPFVSGVVALALAKHRLAGGASPLKTAQDLRDHLARTATDAGSPGKDPSYGWGLIDPARMLAPAAQGFESAPGVRFEDACLVVDGKRYRGRLVFEAGASS